MSATTVVAQSQELREIKDALVVVERSVISCSHAVGSCFEELADSVRMQRKSCGELFGPDGQRMAVALEDGGGLAESLCGPLFDMLTAAFAKTEADLEATCDELAKVQRLVGSLSKIAVQSRMLGLQAAVEGSWLDGETGRHFALAAENIRNLADLAAEMTDKVDSLVVQLSHRLRDFLTALAVSRRRLANAQDTSRALSKDYRGRLRLSEAKTRDVFQGVMVLNEKLNENVNQTIQALQFEDLAVQLIGQIRLGMNPGAVDPGRLRVVTQASMDGGDVEFF